MIKIIKKFFNFSRPEDRKLLITSVVLSLIEAIFNAMKIVAIFFLLDAGFSNDVSFVTPLICLAIMLVSVIGAAIVRNQTTMLQTRAGYHTCACKRMDIAQHLRYVPMGYFNDNSLGKIVSVTTNTMQNLENIATRVIMLVSSAILDTCVITLYVLFFDYRIGLILICGLCLYGLVNHLLMKKSEKIAKLKDKADAELVEQIVEYVEGISEVKSYKITGKKCKKLYDANLTNARTNIKMEKSYIPYLALQTIMIKLTGVAMTFVSILCYLHNSLDLTTCIVLIIASFIIYASLEGASGYVSLLRSVDLYVNKANDILNTSQMELEGDKNSPANLDIKAEHISFSYEQKKIIDDVSFSIPHNTTTAIVGPSGSGKSTIINLISRFWDVDSGIITLGGKNIKDYNYDTLMKNFSFVFQRVYLFKDTIANNIRFGEPDASMERVISASKKAKCHDFIMNLPNGYDTVIGDGGVNLSGGERQRLSIARAIMKDAPIIILDEATANIDPENEADLMQAIDELTHNKTIIMIAHRLKTVKNAHQILVVENGKITMRGSHNELIKKDGIYKSFISDREKAISWKIK